MTDKTTANSKAELLATITKEKTVRLPKDRLPDPTKTNKSIQCKRCGTRFAGSKDATDSYMTAEGCIVCSTKSKGDKS